jgi:hypothetical protein
MCKFRLRGKDWFYSWLGYSPLWWQEDICLSSYILLWPFFPLNGHFSHLVRRFCVVGIRMFSVLWHRKVKSSSMTHSKFLPYVCSGEEEQKYSQEIEISQHISRLQPGHKGRANVRLVEELFNQRAAWRTCMLGVWAITGTVLASRKPSWKSRLTPNRM